MTRDDQDGIPTRIRQEPQTTDFHAKPGQRLTLTFQQPISSLDREKPAPDPLTGLTSLTALHAELAEIIADAEQVTCFYIHLPNARTVLIV